MSKPAIALVSREVAPFAPGGIGAVVAATAELLAESAEVTIFTSARHRRAYEEGKRGGRADLPSARFVFVPEPRGWELGGFRNPMQAWSARLFAALRDTYGDEGPDLVEFPDYLGEGFVTVQARRGGSPGLRRTNVCVRAHTTSEMVRILNGAFPRSLEERLTFALERYALRFCDRFLWGGGDVLGAYERFYGGDARGPELKVRHPFAAANRPEPGPAARGDGPLRLLYLGRLERRKGVRNLVAALDGLDRDGWRLTIAGDDTETAPLGGSMRELLSLEVGDDPRIELMGSVARDAVPALIEEHDAMVVPSLWECWPNVALEALERNRPLIATPVGGLTEMAQLGRSGLVTRGTSAEDLASALADALDHRDELARLSASHGPRSVFEELTDPSAIVDAYLELAKERPAAPSGARPAQASLVSIIIPYHGLPDYVEQAISSAVNQNHANVEVIVVDDGSDPAERDLLEELARRYPIKLIRQRNSGLSAARNFGISQAAGTYVFPLDADNVAHPEFVSRCVDVLERHPEVAYVTSWSRYIDEHGEPWRGIDDGERPIGNHSPLVEEANIAGDAAAVIRRSIFDGGLGYDPELTSYEDWALYRQMRSAGHYGETIPEPLIDYRVRADSMARQVGEPHRERLLEELEARSRSSEIRWTSGDLGEATRNGQERVDQLRAAAAARLERSSAPSAAAAATKLAARRAGPRRRGGLSNATRGAARPLVRRARLVARRIALRLLR